MSYYMMAGFGDAYADKVNADAKASRTSMVIGFGVMLGLVGAGIGALVAHSRTGAIVGGIGGGLCGVFTGSLSHSLDHLFEKGQFKITDANERKTP